MCKPMTDEQLAKVERIVKDVDVSLFNDLLKEVKRLRAEAIVWHPWPGERPEKYEDERDEDYLVRINYPGRVFFDVISYDSCLDRFDIHHGFLDWIESWAEIPESWKGV